MTDVLRTKELEQSSFVEPMKSLPSFTKKQRETYDDLLKKNFDAVTPRNKTILFKKVVANGDTKLVEDIVKNIIEYDMLRTKKPKNVVENNLKLKLPKSERSIFTEILKNVDSVIQPKSVEEKVEADKRQDRIMEDFKGPAYTLSDRAPATRPLQTPVLSEKQKVNLNDSVKLSTVGNLDLSKASEVMTKDNFEKLRSAYNKLNSIVNSQTLEDGSFFTKGVSVLGAPEVEVLQMASKMLGLGFSKKDKSDLRKILDGEDTGRGTAGDIGLVAKMFLNPDEIGGMISHQGKKWGKRISDDAKDFWDTVRGRKKDIFTTASDMEVKDIVASRQSDIKKQINREKDLARLEGDEYKGEEYDPDTLNRLLEVPKLSQYGGRDDYRWDEKLGKTFRDIFGINPMVDTGSKKEKLEQELQSRDPEGYKRYKDAVKKYEATKKKIGIRSRESNIQSEHDGVRKKLGDIIKEALDDNSSLIKSGKDAVFDREQIEDYYDLAEWLKSNDEMSYHNLAQIADNFIEDSKTLDSQVREKLSQWRDEQKSLLKSLGQGDIALDVGSDEEARVEVIKRVEEGLKVEKEAEEIKKLEKEHDDIIKQEAIDKDNEETLNRRKDVTHKGFVNTDNNGIPDLRPRIIFGNTDAQLMETPDEIEEERRTIDTMLMWNARNETEQNTNNNVLYQIQQENERRRYDVTFSMPQPEPPLKPVPEAFINYNERLWVPMYPSKEEQFPPMKDPLRNAEVFSQPESFRNESSSQKVEYATRPLLYPEYWLRRNGKGLRMKF